MAILMAYLEAVKTPKSSHGLIPSIDAAEACDGRVYLSYGGGRAHSHG